MQQGIIAYFSYFPKTIYYRSERTMEMKEKICIIGAGNGGFAVGADLALGGWRVSIYEDEAFAGGIKELFETKTITLTGASRNGEAKFYKVTTDLQDAVSDVDVIICSMPAFAQEITARKLAKVVKPGQIVFLCPGSTGGALVYGKVFHEEGVRVHDTVIAHTQNRDAVTREDACGFA